MDNDRIARAAWNFACDMIDGPHRATDFYHEVIKPIMEMPIDTSPIPDRMTASGVIHNAK